jgi:hypothetical protein
MTKASTSTVRTCTASKKKNDSVASELQKQVALEKKKRGPKKKQLVAEKQAEEENKKKTDQEKAVANVGTVTVSPLNINEVIAIGSEDVEVTETNYTQAANDDWTDAKDAEALARHRISPNHLFGKKHEESTEAKGPAPTEQCTEGTNINESTTVDLTAAEDSPNKKKSKRAEVQSGMKASNPRASVVQELLTSTLTPVPL